MPFRNELLHLLGNACGVSRFRPSLDCGSNFYDHRFHRILVDSVLFGQPGKMVAARSAAFTGYAGAVLSAGAMGKGEVMGWGYSH